MKLCFNYVKVNISNKLIFLFRNGSYYYLLFWFVGRFYYWCYFILVKIFGFIEVNNVENYFL